MSIREYFNRQYQQLSFLNTAVREEFLKLEDSVKQNANSFSQISSAKIRKDFVQIKNVQPKSAKSDVLQKPDNFTKLLSGIQKRVTVLEKQQSKSITLSGGKFVFGNVKGFNIKSILPKTEKQSQSLMDYSARESANEIKHEQIRYMKDILELLNVKADLPGPDANVKKPSEENPISWFKNAILGVAVGALAPLLGGAFAKITGIFSKAKGLLGKIKGGKMLGWAGVAMSAASAFSTMKNAWSDFKAYTGKGHIAAAQSSLLYGTMGVTGNLLNAIGSVVPMPAALPLIGLGSGLISFSEKFRDTAKDESEGFIGQAETKSQQVSKLIEEKKAAGTFLEMRPNISNPSSPYWEYKSGNKWLPIMDNATGSKLSMRSGKDRIIQTGDGTGIQRYKLKTDSGIRDLEIDPSGKIVMRIPNMPNGVPVTSSEKTLSRPSPAVQAKSGTAAKSQSITDPAIQKDLNAVEKDVSGFDKFVGAISGMFESKQLAKVADSKFVSDASTEVGPALTGSVSSSKAGDFSATRGNLTLTRTEAQKQALSDGFNNEMFLGQTNPRITSPFYKWRSPDWYVARGINAKKAHAHGGVDIGVPSGTKVRSLYSGKARVVKGLGLSVDTDRDIRLNYWHIQPSVKNGDSVTLGQELGTVYKDKHSTGPHLHFEVQSLEGMRQDTKIDPGKYVIDPAAWLADKDAPANKFDLLPYKSQTAAFVKGTDGPREIPGYAKGTSYVPEDMVARVHKDEIILTKQQAQKIKAEAKSSKPEISKMASSNEYNVFEDSDFWINTFMPALAEVVRMEYDS